MTATPSDPSCTENAEIYTRQNERVQGEPPQRRAVELPEIVGYMWPYNSAFQMTVDKGKAGIAAQIGYSVSDLCTVTSAITYAEQVAAAEKQRADSLASVIKQALEYWEHRQQRYKNRSPVWVRNAKAILAESEGGSHG